MKSENNESRSLTTFFLGVAAGIVITYLLSSEDKQEIFDRVTGKAGQLRDGLEEVIEKGKNIANNLSEFFQNNPESNS